MMRDPRVPPPDEFYVGYQPRMPRGIARFVRARVAVLLAAGTALAAALAASHRAPAPSIYEYGTVRDVEGTLLDGPYPLLAVPAADGHRVLLLAGRGKHGAGPALVGVAGAAVTLRGTLIQRHDRAMLEVHSAHPRPGGPDAPPMLDHGEVEVHGEIVDGKCHLGAMNPGEGPTHRLCALRCLRGGVPPLLAGRDGQRLVSLLVGPDGAPLGPELLRLVAARVVVRGRLRSVGTLQVLEADPETLRRATP